MSAIVNYYLEADGVKKCFQYTETKLCLVTTGLSLPLNRIEIMLDTWCSLNLTLNGENQQVHTASHNLELIKATKSIFMTNT